MKWKLDNRSAGKMRLWRKHFYALLKGDVDTNTASIDVVPNPIENDGVEILPSSHEKDKVAIARLKNNANSGDLSSSIYTHTYLLT